MEFPWPGGAIPPGEQLRADVINSQVFPGAQGSSLQLGKPWIRGCYLHFMALQSLEVLQKAPAADSTFPKTAGKAPSHPLGSHPEPFLGAPLKPPISGEGDSDTSFGSSSEKPVQALK